MRDLIIGIDAGTSVIKSVVFDRTGRQIAAVARQNRVEMLTGGGAEQDLDRTWRDAAETLAELADEVENLAARVIGIAVTGQGDGTWLIDGDGAPVGRAMLWLDARAGETVEELRARPDDVRRHHLTGTGLVVAQQGPQLHWLHRNAPEKFAAATTSFHCKDWLYFRLTGVRATDPSEACLGFGDFRTRAYSDEVIDFFGLGGHRSLLPDIVDGATTHHPLSDEAAARTGLLAGTPVVLGFIDIVCTPLGAGIFDTEGESSCSILGSTGIHLRLVHGADEVRFGEGRTGYTICMPADDYYVQLQSNMAATLNIDWLLGVAADLLAEMGMSVTKDTLLARVEDWVGEAGSAPPLFHPYISSAGERGPFVDVAARASLIGLDLNHGFRDLVRAVFEGLALATRDCYLAMGPLPSRVKLTGGAARSPALRRTLASALHAGIQTSTREEAGAAGAAMIAAVSLGLYPTLAACSREWAAPYLQPPEMPDDALAGRFDALYPAYRTSREALAPVWHMLAGLRDDAGGTQPEKGR